MIEDWQCNIDDLEITRPPARGVGGDQTGAGVVIATGLKAIYAGKKAAVRRVAGRDVVVTASFVIDPVDNMGNPIDVRPFDQITYTDFRGKKQRAQTIASVTPYWACAELDHIELEI